MSVSTPSFPHVQGPHSFKHRYPATHDYTIPAFESYANKLPPQELSDTYPEAGLLLHPQAGEDRRTSTVNESLYFKEFLFRNLKLLIRSIITVAWLFLFIVSPTLSVPHWDLITVLSIRSFLVSIGSLARSDFSVL